MFVFACLFVCETNTGKSTETPSIIDCKQRDIQVCQEGSDSEPSGKRDNSDKMAAVKEDISDSDLRAKLKENGISYGPITATTKNLYIRKLNKALSEGKSPLRSNKVPSRKSMSPKTFPRRASPSRRSVDPTSPPERKLIGFSSDEDEPAKVPVATRQKRLSGQFKGSPSKSTAHAPIQDEERPVVRRRPNNTSSPKAKLRLDEETMDTDSRVNMNSYTFEPKRGRMPSYTGLRNLFLRKSIEDSKKYANAEPAPEMSYDLEVEDETDRNIYHYTWIIWLLVFVLIVVLLLAFNWKFLSAMLWNRVNINDRKFLSTIHLVIPVFNCYSGYALSKASHFAHLLKD